MPLGAWRILPRRARRVAHLLNVAADEQFYSNLHGREAKMVDLMGYFMCQRLINEAIAQQAVQGAVFIQICTVDNQNHVRLLLPPGIGGRVLGRDAR